MLGGRSLPTSSPMRGRTVPDATDVIKLTIAINNRYAAEKLVETLNEHCKAIATLPDGQLVAMSLMVNGAVVRSDRWVKNAG